MNDHIQSPHLAWRSLKWTDPITNRSRPGALISRSGQSTSKSEALFALGHTPSLINTLVCRRSIPPRPPIRPPPLNHGFVCNQQLTQSSHITGSFLLHHPANPGTSRQPGSGPAPTMDPRAHAFLSDIAQTEEPPLANAGGGSYDVMGRYGACFWDCRISIVGSAAALSLAPHPSSSSSPPASLYLTSPLQPPQREHDGAALLPLTLRRNDPTPFLLTINARLHERRRLPPTGKPAHRKHDAMDRRF